MKRRITCALLASAALAVPGTVSVHAQEAPPPLTVGVEDVHVPATINKLVNRGVRVTAFCNADCVLVVKVKLPPGVAAKLGLSKPVIGVGVDDAVAEERKAIFAKVRAGAGRRLENYNGSKSLKIDVQALP